MQDFQITDTVSKQLLKQILKKSTKDAYIIVTVSIMWFLIQTT